MLLVTWDDWAKRNAVTVVEGRTKSRPQFKGWRVIVVDHEMGEMMEGLNLINVLEGYARAGIDLIEVMVDDEDIIVEPFFYLTIESTDLEKVLRIYSKLNALQGLFEVEKMKDSIRLQVGRHLDRSRVVSYFMDRRKDEGDKGLPRTLGECELRKLVFLSHIASGEIHKPIPEDLMQWTWYRIAVGDRRKPKGEIGILEPHATITDAEYRTMLTPAFAKFIEPHLSCERADALLRKKEANDSSRSR